jgi:hypothetical protein
MDLVLLGGLVGALELKCAPLHRSDPLSQSYRRPGLKPRLDHRGHCRLNVTPF